MATAVRPMPLTLPSPLLRLRSDEQLLALFRSGREDAFRALHDRYHDRLLAYVRHMLRGNSEAEDIVQDVFLRAYGALRTGEREITVRPWLYRVAHNRCIDYVRRAPATPLQPDELLPGGIDPVAAAEQREDLRRLVADLHALPDAQRSALIIRELEGLSYDDLATTLGVTVPAVKSLLVRARSGLAEAAEARDTDCATIREQLALAVDRPGRPPRMLRDHLRGCSGVPRAPPGARHGHAQLASLLPGPSSLLLGGGLVTLLGSSGGAGGAAVSSELDRRRDEGDRRRVCVARRRGRRGRGIPPDPPAEARTTARGHGAPPRRASTPSPSPQGAAPPAAPVHAAPAIAARPDDRHGALPRAGGRVPAIDEEPEPTPTPTPTATPHPTPTPTETPTPEATTTATPEAEPAAEAAATATPTLSRGEHAVIP